MPVGHASDAVRASLFALAVLALASPAQADDDTAKALEGAIEDFEFGEHAAAEKKLFALLNPIKLTSAEDVILARQYLGACYFLLDQRPKSESEFAKILVLDADHKLDPEVFSPALVQFFEDVRSRTGVGLKKQPPPPPDVKDPLTTVPVRDPVVAAPATPSSGKPPFALAFVPFGIGQFSNHHPVRGTLFAVGEVGLFTAAIISYTSFQALGHTDARGAFQVDDAADQGTASTLQSVFLGTLWAGVGLAAIGIAEAVISYPGDNE